MKAELGIDGRGNRAAVERDRPAREIRRVERQLHAVLRLDVERQRIVAHVRARTRPSPCAMLQRPIVSSGSRRTPIRVIAALDERG